ncbi:TIGR02679 domain-containing protein [Xanthomonas hyacinthi]|uniref:TIGR02679 domain-containing protein n=1 Tax=Xanthomonas hyacinthi TaxID=56455 RepID=UPI0013035ED4|nr:TIGR02679 domain-containing protein [Xanthomonas hyacinthi]
MCRLLRLRFANAGADDPLVSVGLDKRDPDAHRVPCPLSGKPSRLARSMRLDIADLDARLRAAGLADSLRDALERLEGPIAAQAKRRRELQSRWTALAAAVERGPLLRAAPSCRVRRPRATGPVQPLALFKRHAVYCPTRAVVRARPPVPACACLPVPCCCCRCCAARCCCCACACA